MDLGFIQGAGSQTTSGEVGGNTVEELRKAMEVGYGTDVASLQGAAALRIQSLDKTMYSTIQENKHFVLFNELAKSNAGATVDEWTEQSGVGGFMGGSTNSETGNIQDAQGSYNRRVGMVKFLMTRREVSFVATLGNNIASAEAVEAQNGAVQLLTDAEYLSFEGNSAVVPTEFDGIDAIMDTLGSVDHVRDAQGASLASVSLVDQSAATIAGFGNFGTPTHLFMSQLCQSDFNTNLDPAFRVPLTNVPGGGISLGSPVVGIRTSWGDVKTCPDVFVRDETQQTPFELQYPAICAKNTFVPGGVAVDATATDSASMFDAARAGNYYWYVVGVNAKGQSVGVMTAQTAVAAGKKVTLTITKSVTGEETGYVIYRSRKNGTNAKDDIRECTRIGRTGNTTVYTDLNRDIPGTTSAYILNLAPSSGAISWKQLLPMMKFALYPTVAATVPWAQLLFGYLRITKRRQHVRIKNIVTSGQRWKPFA